MGSCYANLDKMTMISAAEYRTFVAKNLSESDLQKQCVRWFRATYPKYAKNLFAIANGGYRNKREAKNLKLQGVTPGVPDLQLAVPSGRFAGLFIELKRYDGKTTELQREMMDTLSRSGYCCKVVYGIDEFESVVRQYLLAN